MTKKKIKNKTLLAIFGTTGSLIIVGLVSSTTLWAFISIIKDMLLVFIEPRTTINPYLIIFVAGFVMLFLLGYKLSSSSRFNVSN